MPRRTYLGRFIVVASMAACGGGGGDTPTPVAPRPPQTVTNVALAGVPASLIEGDTATLRATVTTNDTQPWAGSVTWGSSDTTVATVTNTGFVVTRRPGVAVISVTAGTQAGSASIAVAPDPVVVLSLAAPDTVYAGHPDEVVVTAATSRTARPVPVPAGLQVTTADANVVTVTGNTTLSAAVGGRTQLTASAPGAQSATRPITSIVSPVRLAFIFGSDVPAVARRAAHLAAIRWERVFAGPLPTGAPVALQGGYCGITSDSTATPASVIPIWVRVAPLNGPSGQGGVCYNRKAPSALLTILGTVTVDSARVAAARTATDITPVLAHEIGHALGIGTLAFSQKTTGVPGDNPRFTGATAAAQFAALGGRDTTGGVRLETNPSAGPYAHWAVSVLAGELMTGNGGNGRGVLSAVTLGALIDLGYPIKLAAAEPLTLP